jgi:hypothetical protein
VIAILITSQPHMKATARHVPSEKSEHEKVVDGWLAGAKGLKDDSESEEARPAVDKLTAVERRVYASVKKCASSVAAD